jgi:hypothetical protein
MSSVPEPALSIERASNPLTTAIATDREVLLSLPVHVPSATRYLGGYRQLWVKPCWVYYRASDEDVIILHVRRAEKLLELDDLS